MIHLTNDAVQNKCEDYGKYEPGNKLSYVDLQRYLDITYTEQKPSMQTHIYPRMKVSYNASTNTSFCLCWLKMSCMVD